MKRRSTIALGFLALIAVGAIVLSSPWARAAGEWGDLGTGLFTACSAVCVTGLTVVDIAQEFSREGQFVLLALVEDVLLLLYHKPGSRCKLRFLYMCDSYMQQLSKAIREYSLLQSARGKAFLQKPKNGKFPKPYPYTPVLFRKQSCCSSGSATYVFCSLQSVLHLLCFVNKE